MMKIWMEITTDKYQLPLVVADSCTELAGAVGKKANDISSHIGHFKRGDLKKQRFVCVEVEDEE